MMIELICVLIGGIIGFIFGYNSSQFDNYNKK